MSHSHVRAFASIILAGSLLASGHAAHADGLTPQDGRVDNGIDVFMSAPSVQGSFVSGGVLENFNLGCNSAWAMGTMVGTCEGVDADDYGGAAVETGTPSLGGVGSPYARVASQDTITVTLTEDARYLGFWWTGGDDGNTFRFFSEGNLVAEYTTATVLEQLQGDSVTAVSGVSYLSEDYMTNPVPEEDTGEPYVYLHVFAKGDFTFDSFTFTHFRDQGWFEFDNVVTSNNTATPTDSLVYVSSYGDRIADPSGEGNDENDEPGSGELANTGFDTGFAGVIAATTIVGGIALLRIRRRSVR
jgi:hypothetical protein